LADLPRPSVCWTGPHARLRNSDVDGGSLARSALRPHVGSTGRCGLFPGEAAEPLESPGPISQSKEPSSFPGSAKANSPCEAASAPRRRRCAPPNTPVFASSAFTARCLPLWPAGEIDGRICGTAYQPPSTSPVDDSAAPVAHSRKARDPGDPLREGTKTSRASIKTSDRSRPKRASSP